jgi:hypothetical protein
MVSGGDVTPVSDKKTMTLQRNQRGFGNKVLRPCKCIAWQVADPDCAPKTIHSAMHLRKVIIPKDQSKIER